MSSKEDKTKNTAPESNLGRTLTFLMRECDIDDAQLSRETNIPASTISRMRLNPESNPTASTLRPIAKFFSVSIDQLLGDEPLSPNRLPGMHNPTAYTAAIIPLVKWDLISNLNNEEQIPSKIQTSEWISTEKEVSSLAFALTIPTDSFGISLRKGSLIIVDPEEICRDGDLVLMKIKEDNSLVVKQFIKEGNECYIKSVNPDIKGLKLLTDETEIIGIIIETRFNLQEKVKNSTQYKPDSLFNLDPVRAKT